MGHITVRRQVDFSDFFTPPMQMTISGRVFIPDCQDAAKTTKDEKYILVTKDASPSEALLMGTNDPEKVEQVANAICLLIRAYEDKDRPSR